MKKINMITAFLAVSCLLIVSLTFNSCAPTKAVADKSGAQLWAENCQRCHNTPAPSSFGPEQWETIGMHMQTRSLITEKERDKIVDFLKGSR